MENMYTTEDSNACISYGGLLIAGLFC